jgi:hypothetical protein
VAGKVTEPACWLDRRLPDEFARALEPGGGLRWLTDFALGSAGTTFTDLVLVGESKRGRRSKVHLYGGTAGLLTVIWRGNDTVELFARDTKTFGSLAFAPAWRKPCRVDELAPIVPDLVRYLRQKAAVATRGNYGKEGAVQLAVMRGAGSWAAVDREVVPQYRDVPTRGQVEDAFHAPLDAARAQLGAAHRWAASWKRKGNELDCLAVDDDGDLLGVEVKRGEAGDLEQAPLQVAFYEQMLRRCLAESDRTLASVRAVAEQRRRIGLAATTPAISGAPRVRAVVAVSAPAGARARKRWPAVVDAVRASGPLLADLEVWLVEPTGAVHRTGSDLL